MAVGKKTGGRQKGTPNKATQDLMAICEAKGLDPFAAMVELAVTETNRDKKFDRLKEIAQYLYPKRKAVEHSMDADSAGFKVIIEEYGKK